MLLASLGSNLLFDFNKNASSKNWRVVDDVVMGGRSSGNFKINDQGHGEFYGTVSLENNGGFSSVRHDFKRKNVENYSKVVIKLKGDGKNYQFRVKAKSSDYYSYIYTFETNGEWQEVLINLSDMHPSFRGRKLDKHSFEESFIEELAFLIANKKNEKFRLLIDKIELR